MFQTRMAEFDPRVSSIVDHLKAIQDQLTDISRSSGRQASKGAAAAGNQIADVIGPILSDLTERFRRGQRMAKDEGASLGNQAWRLGRRASNRALRIGARAGNEALSQVTSQTREFPLLTIAVAVGVGLLIGAATRR